jgi:tetratricopeptide (TPR) repeat protein
MGNTTASLTHEQLFGGGVTIDGAAEIQSELRDRRDKKPSSELNFAPSKAGRVACFDEKRCYITDGELKPLSYFDADAYIAACGISDDGSVALFMTAYGPSGESTMLIDANTFSTIAAGAVQVSANTVRGINVDSARKKFTLFTAKKRETGWSEKLGFTFALEPTAPADKPQEIPDYGAMKAAERMGIPYEEYAAILKKARDEAESDESWEKELDAKNRAKAGIDSPDSEAFENDAERLRQYEEKTDLSPYELLKKAQSCMNELKETYTEQEEQKAVGYLSLSGLNPNMSTYQLSNAYKELGQIYDRNELKQKALDAYREGLRLNPGLSVKKRIKQLEKELNA